MRQIRIENAWEGNLKNVTLDIPRNKLVVFTGLSGSGKSTLLMDVLFNECQRQYLEAISLEGIHKPKVERIRGASPAVAVLQTDANKNPRSTVGTVSNVYTDLRMIYEKLGVRSCPYCGKTIQAAQCREETEKRGSDFFVYMYCSECGRRMDKITRTHFSFNTREGGCPTCQGLGKIHSVNCERVLDEELTLEEGAVRFFEKQYGKYQISNLYAAYRSCGIPVPEKLPVRELSRIQKAVLLEGIKCREVEEAFPEFKVPQKLADGRFEGIKPILLRRFAEKNAEGGQLEQYFEIVECPDCKGERISRNAREITVGGVRLPQLSGFSMEKLLGWVKELGGSLQEGNAALAEAYLRDIETKLKRFIRVGLGYLSLDRQTITLSGGELQRLRLAAILDSELTGIIYILDEPTAGLHPKDTEGLIAVLRRLRDLENTVLVIEHDTDVMKAADYLVDIGPGAGKYGGEIVARGSFEDVRQNGESVTAKCLREEQQIKWKHTGTVGESILIQQADLFNLKNIDTEIPVGCLTVITGPSGSGKSTLIFEVLAKGSSRTQKNKVVGLEKFQRVIEIQQSPIARMKRSNVATYSEVYTEIRTIFAGMEDARKKGMTAKHFSFNTPGGRCENCEGLGKVDSNMLFFTNIEMVCPVCGGSRFREEVLAVKYQGLSIRDVLNLSVDEAAEFFKEHIKISSILNLLLDVGLGYLELGQTLTTLSGGEGQRLKLAKELTGGRGGRNLYLLDEPTTGLHPKDVEHFLILLDRLVEAGNTVVVVEHNQQMIRRSDWVIDLGPEGGEEGGEIVFTGTPEQLAKTGESATAQYLRF